MLVSFFLVFHFMLNLAYVTLAYTVRIQEILFEQSGISERTKKAIKNNSCILHLNNLYFYTYPLHKKGVNFMY